MESRPPDAQPKAPRPAQRPATPDDPQGSIPPAARQYPKPPPLAPRMAMLCLRPESWAESARYPTHVTLIALMLAILMAAISFGIVETRRLVQAVAALPAYYQAQGYPPLVYGSDGTLSVQGELEEPIRIPFLDTMILIDPTGNTAPEALHSPGAILITDRKLYLLGGESPDFDMDLATTLGYLQIKAPAPGHTRIFDSTALGEWVRQTTPVFVASGGITIAFSVLRESIWAALAIFLVTPFITIAAAGPLRSAGNSAPGHRLMIPRRAAIRMAAALLVPLILLNAVTHALGYPVSRVVGPQFTATLWLVAALALGVWTGLMARRMYAPGNPRQTASR